MKRTPFLILLLGVWLILGSSISPGKALSQAAQEPVPGYKLSLIKRSAQSALDSVGAGASPVQDCTMVSMLGREIMKSNFEDTVAMALVSEAMEICGFEVATAYFNTILDGVDSKMAETPDSPVPCQDFVTEFSLYFTLVKEGPERLADDGTSVPSAVDRVKAELSDRVTATCAFAAAMLGFI